METLREQSVALDKAAMELYNLGINCIDTETTDELNAMAFKIKLRAQLIREECDRVLDETIACVEAIENHE